MEETKVIDDESSRWSTSSDHHHDDGVRGDESEEVTAVEYPRRRNSQYVAPFPIVLEVDTLDEGYEDSSEEVAAVGSSIIAAEPRSGGSAPSLAEEEKDHERDDQDEEKPKSSVANLRGGESSPPHSEAKGDHWYGEDEDNIEIPRWPPSTSSAETPSTRSASQENGTEDSRMPSLDISTMKMAVQSGNPKAVDDLMERLSDTLAVDALTTTYGGVHTTYADGRIAYEADKDSLFRGTSPILHAARSGNLAVFESVMKAMEATLSREQVKEMLARNDDMGQSLLSLAARSGSKDALEGVLLVIRREFTEFEVKVMLAEMEKNGGSPLKMAARSGSKDVLERVLGVIRREFPENEDVLAGDDGAAFSLLASAVRSGSMDVVEHVLFVIRQEFSGNAVKNIISSRDGRGDSLLTWAVKSKSVEMFKAVMMVVIGNLLEEEVKNIISSRNGRGDSLLAYAVNSWSVEMFKAVMIVVVDNLLEEVKEMILRRDDDRYSLLTRMIANARTEMFRAFMSTVADKLTEAEVKSIISSRDGHGDSLLSSAVKSHSVEMLEAVMVVVVDNLLEEEVVELLCEKNVSGWTRLGKVITDGNLGMFEIILRNVQDYLGHTKMQAALDAAFLSWKRLYEKDHARCTITRESTLSKILSMLLRHSARPPTEFLQWAARDFTDGKEPLWPIFTESLLIEVESASNPLIPGMNLSVPLAEAAVGAREGERRRLISLQNRVDKYLLEVLERLPQTIQGFDKGMTQCSALFEPEGPRNGLCGRPGPLRVAFERRHQMESLCTVPLVMDYLSRRFTSGLPDLRDSGRVLRDKTALSRLAEDDVVGGGLVLGYTQDSDGRHVFDRDPFGESWISFLRGVLQGADAQYLILTFLPGAQFIIAGLLAKPNVYYRVPAMRMAMDFVVYIMMLAFYSFCVLLHEDGPLTTAEIFFASYVLAGVITEAGEINRNLKIYLQDPWNFFDALALVMLAGGFFVRLAYCGSTWGRALYALSAPLVFSRILFFMQILQFQGPMIQVMFSMGLVLLQFAVVLLVVMMGFAMALYPLLRDDNNSRTFDAISLLLFKTLLGDVGAFAEFDDSTQSRYSTVGHLLLAVYLVIITIMLLNLLIAVLSTKHTKVDVKADKEFKVSRARIIEHYRLAVAFNILPAPFNLWQLVLTLPFLFKGQPAEQNKRYTKAMEAVGQVSFWLVLSPFCFAGGVLLWVTSSMYNVGQASKWLSHFKTSAELTGASLALNYVMLCFWCALGAPLCLLALWLRQPFIFIYNGVIPSRIRLGQGERDHWTRPASARGNKKSDADVQKMLKDAGTGASDLRKCLEDPMCDPKVRSDEVDRGTTVKHMKLLRDRLEKKFNERVDHLNKKFGEHVNHLDKKFHEHVNHLGKELNERVDHLDKKFSEHVDHLGKDFNERVNHLGKDFNERVDSLEANTNALASEMNRKIGLVLEALQRK